MFDAFSDADQLEKWWGPVGWQTKTLSMAFKPGGAWHYSMECIDQNQGDFFGEIHWSKSVFQEIQRPDKIVYTDAFTDEDGNYLDGMPGKSVTITFEEIDGETLLTLRTQFTSSQALADSGFALGMESSLNRLEELLK